MGGYKELKVWQLSFQLSLEIYRITKMYSKEEKYGLVAQMRRCAVSIPSNISEGYGRGSDAQLKMFLQYALGSANELETQIMISMELGECDKVIHDPLILKLEHIQRMLANFIKKLKAKS